MNKYVFASLEAAGLTAFVGCGLIVTVISLLINYGA